jgi:nicotinamidase/pyrazinamidase
MCARSRDDVRFRHWHARCSFLRRSSKEGAVPSGQSIEFDGRTALIVVDVQNDFAHPDGSLCVAGAAEVLPAINALVRKAVAEGAFVVYTQDYHPEVTPHFREHGGRWPKHCVQGTWGAELVAELEIAGPVVKKGIGGENGYSGFLVRNHSGRTRQTELFELLQSRGIERVVVCGFALDFCVKETALDAVRLGFECEVALEATRAVDPASKEEVVRELAGAEVLLR